MEKFEQLTRDQLVAKETELTDKGYSEAQTVVTVEPGSLDGKPQIVTKGKTKSANFFIITYVRNKENRYFKGSYFDAKHLSNGKTYNNLAVGMNETDIDTLSKPENLSKSYELRAESYTNTEGRKTTTVKMVG